MTQEAVESATAGIVIRTEAEYQESMRRRTLCSRTLYLMHYHTEIEGLFWQYPKDIPIIQLEDGRELKAFLISYEDTKKQSDIQIAHLVLDIPTKRGQILTTVAKISHDSVTSQHGKELEGKALEEVHTIIDFLYDPKNQSSAQTAQASAS